MNSPAILLMGPIYPTVQKKLESKYKVHRYWETRDLDALFGSLASTCQVIVTTSIHGMDSDTLNRLPSVKLVACFGTGVDLIDLDYCAANDIAVTHTPDVLTDDVADLTIGLLLTLLRRIAAPIGLSERKSGSNIILS